MKKCLPLQRFNKQMIVLQIKKAKKMKKLVLMFVAIAAISFASCDNKAKQDAAQTDSTAQNDTMGDSLQNAPADSAQNDTVK